MAKSILLTALMMLSISASEASEMAPEKLIASLVGNWEGTCKTWFKPGELADESPVTGSFEYMLGERFLRHTYTSQLQGNPRTGEEIVAYNPAQNQYQTAWVDAFHMNYGILFSEGESTTSGFTVTGKYAVGGDRPPWSWKTVYEVPDSTHLTITAYNISPEGKADKAVETKYVRIE